MKKYLMILISCVLLLCACSANSSAALDGPGVTRPIRIKTIQIHQSGGVAGVNIDYTITSGGTLVIKDNKKNSFETYLIPDKDLDYFLNYKYKDIKETELDLHVTDAYDYENTITYDDGSTFVSSVYLSDIFEKINVIRNSHRE